MFSLILTALRIFINFSLTVIIQAQSKNHDTSSNLLMTN